VPKTCDGEKTASSTNVSGISAYRKLKLGPHLSPCTSINTKWIKNLNIRPKTLKLVQERAGNKLELKGIGNDIFNTTQMTQELGERIYI
jgi:hypothetical protein